MRKFLSLLLLTGLVFVAQAQVETKPAANFQDAFELYVDKLVAAVEAYETNTDTSAAKADLQSYQASLTASYDVNYELDKVWPWNNPCYVACSKEFYNCSSCWKCWNACIILAGDCIRQCWGKPIPIK
jgi:hypothetical protein